MLQCVEHSPLSQFLSIAAFKSKIKSDKKTRKRVATKHEIQSLTKIWILEIFFTRISFVALLLLELSPAAILLEHPAQLYTVQKIA